MDLKEILDLVERLETSLEKMANTCTADMDIWNEHSNAVLEAASRIRELEGEVERLTKANEHHRYMRANLAPSRDAALADNERLREALAFYASAETWKASGHPQIDADTKPILRDGGKRARAALKGDTNDA